MKGVRFNQISKSFGDVSVLEEIDLAVGEGEFLVLVGPSGCGKSTLLRCVAGLESPTSGRLFIGDRDVTEVEPRERDVAMVFQSYALYPHMTVAENMGFALRIQNRPQTEIDGAVQEAASMLGLESLLHRMPRELSGGQRQRVAMGRAVVRRPKVFLFDEPLSNLDAALRSQLRVELKRLHRDLGATMIYVTHDQVEAMTLADRIAVLKDGTLQQLGSPTELYRNPANRFVAGFIGSPPMCFLESLEADCVVGVRPTDVVLGQGDLMGTVDVVEPLGAQSYVHISVGNDRMVAMADVPPESGSQIAMELKHTIRFDRATGMRIG
ncbi:MAG: ABC transporter ATP-binding protein [Myxococcota bacterium]|nr:ABC transporter ATP-binding protein [Myxococcota bacterium]MEC9391625.1 ABC transporter ATP-binding protein [Myxococcota bacterium]